MSPERLAPRQMTAASSAPRRTGRSTAARQRSSAARSSRGSVSCRASSDRTSSGAGARAQGGDRGAVGRQRRRSVRRLGAAREDRGEALAERRVDQAGLRAHQGVEALADQRERVLGAVGGRQIVQQRLDARAQRVPLAEQHPLDARAAASGGPGTMRPPPRSRAGAARAWDRGRRPGSRRRPAAAPRSAPPRAGGRRGRSRRPSPVISRSTSKRLARTMAISTDSGMTISAITATSCSHHSGGTTAATTSASRTGTVPT